MDLAVPPVFTLCAADTLHIPATVPAFLLERETEQELRQIERFGQIHPILITAAASGGEMLAQSHLAHALALKKAGAGQVACRLIPPQADALFRFSLRILCDAQTVGSSVLWQACLLQEAAAVLALEEQLQLLPLMGLKAQRHVLEERIRLLRLDPGAQEALHRQVLHSRCAAAMLRLPAVEQRQLVDLITHYRLGGSKQQKLVDLVLELHLRQGSTIAALLAQWRQKKSLPRNNLPQESQSLLDYLQQLYHPRISDAEEAFREKVRCLRVPEGVQITHTQAFEDEGLSVHLHYSDWAALQARWPQLLKGMEKGSQEG